MKKKRVIIFGGNGFIGKHLANYLLLKNCNVTIFDQEINKKQFDNKIKFVKGNIINIKKVDEALKKIDYIFHFAGEADIYRANKDPLSAVKKIY